MKDYEDARPGQPAGEANGLQHVVVALLKGVLYQEERPELWQPLLNLQSSVRDYVAILGLELTVDEPEGYSFLRYRQDGDGGQVEIPRLFSRRKLSYPISLLLVLLRKKMAEHDASAGDTRLILSRDEVVEMVRIFMPESSNEARHIDQIDANLNKIADLGFIRRLRGNPPEIEVRRIIKAFINAEWLSNMDKMLEAYRQESMESQEGE